MKRFAPLPMLLLLFSSNLFAAEDLTGKWSGTLVMTVGDRAPRNGPVFLVVKQTGTTFTGTMGPNEKEQNAPVKGIVETVQKDGKDITSVALNMSPGGDSLVMRFALTFVDGQLKGTAQLDYEGQKMTAALDVTRVK